MRYLIAFPICLFLISGAIWLTSQRSYQTTAQEGQTTNFPDRSSKDKIINQVPITEPMEETIFDPIVISGCALVPIQEYNVASQIDGLLTEVHVSLGTMVDKGHLLAQLDDQKLRLQMELLQIKANSTSSEKIAEAMFEEAEAKVKYAQKANESGLTSVPELELKTYLAQRDRFAFEIKKAVEDRAEARKELEKAKAHFDMHKIQSALQGEVVKNFKKPGETVKQGESLFCVAHMNRLRIEGFCKVQNVRLLRTGQHVLVEPELQGPHVADLIGHTAPVNQLAISADGKLLASASDDGTVSIWSWPGGFRLATLPHPGPVHAVDLIQRTKDSRPEYLLVTGGEDCLVRVWTCSPNGNVEGPVFQLQGHEGVVRSVAFSPDGEICASGGEDRKIGLWDLKDGKNIGWVCSLGAFKKSAHQGTVTGLQFAGPGNLVSLGSDNLEKVWKIEGGKAQLIKVHPGRTGDVGRLGLGHDGRQVLLDHGDELRVLERDEGTVQGVLHNSKNIRFEGFACFSPSNELILTSAGDGRLQLWKTPAGPKDRVALYKKFQSDPRNLPNLGGFEVCQYQLPKAAQARCGIFAPDESVFFTAGSNRIIRAWAVPAKTEWQARAAVLTYVGSAVEPGTDLVRIQAEIDNPADRSRWWLPGTYVNLKIFP